MKLLKTAAAVAVAGAVTVAATASTSGSSSATTLRHRRGAPGAVRESDFVFDTCTLTSARANLSRPRAESVTALVSAGTPDRAQRSALAGSLGCREWEWCSAWRKCPETRPLRGRRVEAEPIGPPLGSVITT